MHLCLKSNNRIGSNVGDTKVGVYAYYRVDCLPFVVPHFLIFWIVLNFQLLVCKLSIWFFFYFLFFFLFFWGRIKCKVIFLKPLVKKCRSCSCQLLFIHALSFITEQLHWFLSKKKKVKYSAIDKHWILRRGKWVCWGLFF